MRTLIDFIGFAIINGEQTFKGIPLPTSDLTDYGSRLAFAEKAAKEIIEKYFRYGCPYLNLKSKEERAAQVIINYENCGL